MSDSRDPSALLLDHLPWIDRVATMVCRKHGMWGDDADDFVSLARLKVIDGDYALLRAFRGECALTTYLAGIVVQRFHEWVRERRGRWRTSAAAERIGPPAPELEALVYRDGCTLGEAGERLRSAGRTTATDGELARILAAVPARGPLRPTDVGDAPLAHRPSADRADVTVRAAENEAERAVLLSALERALTALEPEDALIVRLRFGDGRSVADIARGLGLDQRMLYRRAGRLRERLRTLMEEMGVSSDDVRAALVPDGREDEA